MLVESNQIYLGSEVYNDDPKIVFVDGDLDVHDDTEAIDLETDIDHLWSISPTATALEFVNEQTGETLLTLGEGAGFGEGVVLTGEFEDVNITDSMMRLSGADNIFEIRNSESDWDQILELHRQSNSDYEMHLHYGGSPREVLTTAHDVDAASLGGEPAADYLLGGLDIRDGGTLYAEEVSSISFGNDLGVTATVAGVEIDYVGSEIPSRVFDDGTEVLANANGIDFLADLDVAIGTNDVAEISVNLPSTLAHTDANETVGGTWTFTNEIDGTANHAVTADTATVAEGLTSTAAANYIRTDSAATFTATHTHDATVRMGTDHELTLGDGDEFRWRHAAASGDLLLEDHTGGAQTIFRIDPTADTIDTSFTYQQNGNPVATQTWVETEADTFDPSEAHTFTAEQTFDGNIDATNSDYIALPVHSSAPDTTGWPDGAGWFRSDEV